ncbi:MAG: tetratricopeptide repeat protein [Candidatus Thorarchaeota archaeon]|jgi:tetratricopeptide (TPR) repeat protein
MGERNDDVRTPPATLEELVEKELKHTRHYRNHLESGETHYTSGRYEEAVVPLATAAELLRNKVVDLRFKSVSERPKEIKIKVYKTNIRFSYPTLASIADPMEKTHFTTMMICADSLMKLKRYDDACSELEKGLAIANEVSDAWLMLGIAQHCVGDPDKALGSFREAVRQNPARLDLWEILQREYLILDRAESKLVSEGLEKNKRLEDNMALLADLFIAGGEYGKAQSVIDNLLKRDKKNKRVHFPLSKLHIINGEYTKAQDTLKKFIKSDKNNLEALWYLACVCAFQGKNKDSLKSLEQLLKLDHSHPNGLELQRILTTNEIEKVALLKESIM